MWKCLGAGDTAGSRARALLPLRVATLARTFRAIFSYQPPLQLSAYMGL